MELLMPSSHCFTLISKATLPLRDLFSSTYNKNTELPYIYIVIFLFFISVSGNSIFYAIGHDTSIDLPVSGKFGYVTFTGKGGSVVYFDLKNERYEFQIFVSTFDVYFKPSNRSIFPYSKLIQ